jgi:hypothetical protein
MRVKREVKLRAGRMVETVNKLGGCSATEVEGLSGFTGIHPPLQLQLHSTTSQELHATIKYEKGEERHSKSTTTCLEA